MLYLASALALQISCAGAILSQSALACEPAQCGQACVDLNTDLNCATNLDPTSTSSNSSYWAEESYVMEDTGGLITPFDLTDLHFVPQIASLRYSIPTKNDTAGSCPYIEFWFYDTNQQIVDFTVIVPGQLHSPCISFNGSYVVAYSGLTQATKPPADLLEWVDEGSPL